MLFKKSVASTANLFKKTYAPVGSFFRKGGARMAVDQISRNFGGVGKTLGSINKIGNKVLTSDIAQELVNMTGPNSMVRGTYNGLLGANRVIGTGGQVFRQGGELANRKNYKGDTGDVMVNILERGKRIHDTSKDIHFA